VTPEKVLLTNDQHSPRCAGLYRRPRSSARRRGPALWEGVSVGFGSASGDSATLVIWTNNPEDRRLSPQRPRYSDHAKPSSRQKVDPTPHQVDVTMYDRGSDLTRAVTRARATQVRLPNGRIDLCRGGEQHRVKRADGGSVSCCLCEKGYRTRTSLAAPET